MKKGVGDGVGLIEQEVKCFRGGKMGCWFACLRFRAKQRSSPVSSAETTPAKSGVSGWRGFVARPCLPRFCAY